MIWKDIMPLEASDPLSQFSHAPPDSLMINHCPIIPEEQHQTYYRGVDVKLLRELSDLNFPGYVLDLAMCYTKLKIIVANTPVATFIKEYCKTHDFCAAFRRLQTPFLGPSFSQQWRSYRPLSTRENSRATTSRPILLTTKRSSSK